VAAKQGTDVQFCKPSRNKRILSWFQSRLSCAQQPVFWSRDRVCSLGRVVLIGDAAHSVWPALGQGCNVAIESCGVLQGAALFFDAARP
jgi:2-polyprenyl-6-methoxyphenol hydroxylase-like FAD-dependent oxidoreductase